jgi:hypothetical protein
MISLRTTLSLMIVIGCIVLTAGCASQTPAVNETAPIIPNKDFRRPTYTPDPNSTPYVPGGNQLLITDFPRFLAEWNDKMHWGYSPQQIENYSRKLEEGVFKKYKINPDYPTLNIPDMKPFCLEVGDAIGLSKTQSEVFATAADNELRRAKITSNPPLAIDILSIDNCSISFERGKQKQLNISYQYTADPRPGVVHFTSTQTPLNLVFDPPEFTVKPYTEIPVVITITASPSLAPGSYPLGIMIDGRIISELRCRAGGPVVNYGQRIINVTVV